MKQVSVISTAVLLLLLGTSVSVYAQREQQGKEQGRPQQEQQRHEGQPAQQQHQPQAVRPPQANRPQENKPQASRPAQRPGGPQQGHGGVYSGGVRPNGPTHGGVHQSGVPQHQGQVHSGFGQSRAGSWDNDHRTWGQRGGYNGYRVPEDRFKLYFGSDHYFRIGSLPMVFVGGYPRFQYDGYAVTFVDPWPETWPATWYRTDDVYIDYGNDGYYMHDRMRPGPGIAVTIAF